MKGTDTNTATATFFSTIGISLSNRVTAWKLTPRPRRTWAQRRRRGRGEGDEDTETTRKNTLWDLWWGRCGYDILSDSIMILIYCMGVPILSWFMIQHRSTNLLSADHYHYVMASLAVKGGGVKTSLEDHLGIWNEFLCPFFHVRSVLQLSTEYWTPMRYWIA